jgi:hypothetical protein
VVDRPNPAQPDQEKGMKTFLHDLRWMLPTSLGVGALLSALARGTWWIGWLVFSGLFFLGCCALVALWRWAGGGRTLGVMLLLAVILRLGLGVSLTFLLPAFGTGSRLQKYGYVLADAYVQDSTAWLLAHSPQPIWVAFEKSYNADQYGGLLALNATLYRYLSLDVQRPWLLVLLAAMAAGAGVAIAWKAVRKVWGEALALPVGWILALYPESILLGSSQMREPFLITFVIMLFWGIVDWQADRKRSSWLWMAGALVGMLLVQPGIAIFALPALGGWAWLRSRQTRLPWPSLLLIVLVVIAALALLLPGLARGQIAITSPAKALASYLQGTAKWNTFVQEQNSGWLKRVFQVLPKSLHLPFMTAYGLTQPLLPATLADPSVLLWRVLNSVLALGWYALLPFLAMSVFALRSTPGREEQRAWIWLWVITWVWIIIASFRAGGTQWDSPRYRSWFLLFQALLATKALVWWRETRTPWMARILAVEAVFLALFGFWYASRYGNLGMRPLDVFVIMAATVAVSGLILLGSWIADLARKRGGRQP